MGNVTLFVIINFMWTHPGLELDLMFELAILPWQVYYDCESPKAKPISQFVKISFLGFFFHFREIQRTKCNFQKCIA